MEPESSLPHSQVPITCPYPVPARSSPHSLVPLSEDRSQYYPVIYVWVSHVVSFLQVSPPKHCMRLSFPPCALHVAPISFFSILSSGQHWVKRTDHSAPLLCSFLHSPVTPSLLGPNILLNTLFSNTLSLRSSLIVSDQVSHPYKTTGI